MKYKFEITVSGTAAANVREDEIIRPFTAKEIAAGIGARIQHELESATQKHFKVEIRAL